MLSQRTVEMFVGLFLMAAIAALLVLAFKVSGLTSFFKTDGYVVHAVFDDIGQLKIRSAVKMSGVTIGEVTEIKLDPTTYRADVSMLINAKMADIPDDSSAAILTAGLLGDNYIALTPMYSSTFLKNGSVIAETHSAMILEKLIGQLVYKISGGNNANSGTSGNGDAAPDSTKSHSSTGVKK